MEARKGAARQAPLMSDVAARALRRGDFATIGVLAHRLGHTGEARTVEAIGQSLVNAVMGEPFVNVVPTELIVRDSTAAPRA